MLNEDLGIAYVKMPSEMAVRVTISEFRDKIYVHIREYGIDIEEFRWFPTKSGYAIHAEGLESVIALLEKASSIYNAYYDDRQQLRFDFKEE